MNLQKVGRAVAVVIFAAASAGCGLFEASETSTLKVTGMWCATCVRPVQEAAAAVDGVIRADVSYEEGTAVVLFNPRKTNPDAIAQAISELPPFKAAVASEAP
jgi:copper chaperone